MMYDESDKAFKKYSEDQNVKSSNTNTKTISQQLEEEVRGAFYSGYYYGQRDLELRARAIQEAQAPKCETMKEPGPKTERLFP